MVSVAARREVVWQLQRMSGSARVPKRRFHPNWHRHFNAIRQHGMNYLTPLQFKQQHYPTPPEPFSENISPEYPGADHNKHALK